MRCNTSDFLSGFFHVVKTSSLVIASRLLRNVIHVYFIITVVLFAASSSGSVLQFPCLVARLTAEFFTAPVLNCISRIESPTRSVKTTRRVACPSHACPVVYACKNDTRQNAPRDFSLRVCSTKSLVILSYLRRRRDKWWRSL